MSTLSLSHLGRILGMAHFSFWFAAVIATSAWAQELSADYRTELEKIGDPVARGELEAALRTLHLHFEKVTPSAREEAFLKVLNSRQEELVFLYTTKQEITLGRKDTWADNNLRLLTRNMLRILDEHLLSSERGGSVERISEAILRILQRHGVQMEEGDQLVRDEYSLKAYDWLELWLGRARKVAKPGTEFHQMVHECLDMATEHRSSLQRRLWREALRAKETRAPRATAVAPERPAQKQAARTADGKTATEPVAGMAWAANPLYWLAGLAALVGGGWLFHALRRK